MTKYFPLFRRTLGLNTVIDPASFDYSEEGVIFLSSCDNIELESSNGGRRISMRRGHSSLLSGELHSLFSAGNYALAVRNVSGSYYLSWIDSAGNTGTIVAITHYENRMAYARNYDRIYYSNGVEKGYVENKTNHTWEAESYSGFDSTRVLQDPLAGHLLEIAFGRIWIAKDDFIIFSEPFAYSQFDYARCFIPLEGRITLLKSVTDGLYVSDDRFIYFIYGTNPKEMSPMRVAQYCAIPGAVVPDLIPGTLLGLQDSYPYIVFMTERGICAGGSQGRFFNLTENRITIPASARGSAVLKNNNNFLFLLER